MVSTPARHMGVAHSYCYEPLITYRDRDMRIEGQEQRHVEKYRDTNTWSGAGRGTETGMMTEG